MVAAAAYQSRERLLDERTGQVKDYRHKTEQETLFSGLYVPKDAPEWARDRQALWNAAEQAEDAYNRTRAKTARTGQHLEIALPHELTPEQCRYVLQDFIRDTFTRRGYAVDLNIHAADSGGDSRNVHAHLLISLRTLTAQGFSPDKARLNHREITEQVTQWREGWARTANRHLERHGHEARIDHRSLKAQGIEREATQHLGPTATQMERKGKASERGEQNRQIERRSQPRQNLKALHRELSQVRGEIESEQLAVRLADIQRPTVGLWQATRAREAQQAAPPPPKAAPSVLKGLGGILAAIAAPPPAAKVAPAPQPARPLADAEPQPEKKDPKQALLDSLHRQREERAEAKKSAKKGRGLSPTSQLFDALYKKRDGPG